MSLPQAKTYELNEATRHIGIPEHLRGRPIDERGYLVPWFVAQVGPDKWDFRAIRPNGVNRAVNQRSCWLCGNKLGRYVTFVVGPMCVCNGISSEPPSHKSCAVYAAQACPFLTKPAMRRNEKNMPEGAQEPPGEMLKRNPGVCVLWTTTNYKYTRQCLFEMGEPTYLEAWCEGRKATLAEIQHSVDTGLPLLRAACDREPTEALRRMAHAELDAAVVKAAVRLVEAAA
jgi:hypothetical protein